MQNLNHPYWRQKRLFSLENEYTFVNLILVNLSVAKHYELSVRSHPGFRMTPCMVVGV